MMEVLLLFSALFLPLRCQTFDSGKDGKIHFMLLNFSEKKLGQGTRRLVNPDLTGN